MSNFSKHLDSTQCKKGGKYTVGLRAARNSLNCIHCDKLCNTINSLAQHEIRCKNNPDKISVEYLKNRTLKAHAISPVPCTFCEKLFTTKSGLSNHKIRCKNNPDRKLQVMSIEGKAQSKIKNKTWVEKHYSDPANRLKVSKRMQRAVIEYPDSYTGNSSRRVKRIKYNGIEFMGKWEVDFYKWCILKGVSVERSKKWFDYEFNGPHRYNPDFYLPELDIYVEVKGQQTDKDTAKWNQFPVDIYIVRLKEITLIRQEQFTVSLLLFNKWIKQDNGPS